MDSIVLTVPISSPLHPQSILPCLQGYFDQSEFSMKTIDSNIKFFWSLLGEDYDISDLKKFKEDPIKVLNFYNKMENFIADKAGLYKDCSIGLRSSRIGSYNRASFQEVKESLYDTEVNPFIEFYENLIEEELISDQPKIVGISITFQDQIIAAFTLARLIREKMPYVKIVLGGQIITRCHDTLHQFLCMWMADM